MRRHSSACHSQCSEQLGYFQHGLGQRARPGPMVMLRPISWARFAPTVRRPAQMRGAVHRGEFWRSGPEGPLGRLAGRDRGRPRWRAAVCPGLPAWPDWSTSWLWRLLSPDRNSPSKAAPQLFVHAVILVGKIDAAGTAPSSVVYRAVLAVPYAKAAACGRSGRGIARGIPLRAGTLQGSVVNKDRLMRAGPGAGKSSAPPRWPRRTLPDLTSERHHRLILCSHSTLAPDQDLPHVPVFRALSRCRGRAAQRDRARIPW